MIKICVDCMGSDNGSKATVGGIKNFLKTHKDVQIIAVGRKEELTELESYSQVEIVDVPDVVPMTVSPLEVMRARKSSMYQAINLTKENGYDAVVSAGSTGGFLSCATMRLKLVEGIQRAALVTPFPTKSGNPLTILDIGANAETTPEQLKQFALMGRIYSQNVFKKEEPRLYLLSNGAEEEKGSPEVKQAHKLLKESNFPGFKGNIEAREALDGDCDVIITGGFAGNIFLKACEGVAKMMQSMIKDAFKKNIFTMIGYLFANSGFKKMKEIMNYKSYGGAMLLGVNGVVVKAHGNSDDYSFGCALDLAYRMAQSNLVNLLRDGVKENTPIEEKGE
ncbi:MAG: phosphate acyltransferase PlsX [Erysipelotrichaceae bacterium]|nr:phosphate acyltransferase PlsX [Erysipelotrichaceae bacterium]